MKKYTFQIIIALLFAAAGGCFSCSHENPPDIETALVLSPDSLFDPTGNAILDSLLLLAASTNKDTLLAELYYEIGEQYQDNDFEKAKLYYLKLKDLSEQLDWNTGRYWYSSGYSLVLAREGLNDSAIVINRQAFELAKKEKNERWMAIININTGNAYLSKEWFETALQYYMEGLSYFEKKNETEKIGNVYQKIAQVYKSLNLVEKSVEFGKKAIELQPNDPYAFLSLAIAYSQARDFDKAKYYHEEALRISRLQNNTYLMEFLYYQLSIDALGFYDLYGAAMYLDKMQEVCGDNCSFYLQYLITRGKIESLKGDFAQAEKYAVQALALATEQGAIIAKKNCYLLLCELTLAQGRFRENTQYQDELELVEVAMAKETAVRSATEMEAKYETEKKELKITALEEEKRFMTWLSISGGAVLLLSLASCLFLWRWTLQKRRLAEQQIKQLIQEKQLVATQSVLDGETRERARLARDLHDGLGSLLTGAKMQLLEMKQGVKLGNADVERFDKAVGLLDHSVNEMRRVAHHLMPDSLSRFGLRPAVTDFCLDLPSVKFTYYGDESRLDPNMEVMIYRCIHELVNNALKHANASKIMVQIIQEPDRIAFAVQDNGCGFNPSATTEGTGLQNIRTRVEAYNGLLDIDSKADEGTEVNGELRIELEKSH